MQEFLGSGKMIAAYDASVKNGLMGACWVMMTRENEKIMNHEMREKDWGHDASKTKEAVMLLDLITTLTKKSHSINQGEIDICKDNREIWKIIDSTKKI